MTLSKLRFAKKKDFEFFFKGDPAYYSAKAWVLMQGKDRLAIGGVWLADKHFISFVRIKKVISKKDFWKVSKYVTQQLLKLNLPITCFRDESMLNSKRYLEKLGYVFQKKVNNQELYKLCKQPYQR
jgi:hypothetical protein